MKKNIYNAAICILAPMLLVMFILAFDAFTYGEMVHKSYKFHRNCDMIGRMAAVIENDESLAAYRIMTIWPKDGSSKSKEQFKRLSANEYKDYFECYLFDYASDNIFGLLYYSSAETLNDYNKIELFSVSSISGNKLCLQSKDSIPITTFVRPQLCGLFSSYDSSRSNSSLFEESLIKKMGLDHKEAYEMTAESGSILQRLFPYEPGSEQWYNCRNTIYIVFVFNIILLVLFIVLRARTK